MSWKDKREVASDLREIYVVLTLEKAKFKMEEFKKKWGSKYPPIVNSWRNNWEELMTYFNYPFEMRKLMYTTNIIESVNSRFRKATDGKKVFSQ